MYKCFILIILIFSKCAYSEISNEDRLYELMNSYNEVIENKKESEDPIYVKIIKLIKTNKIKYKDQRKFIKNLVIVTEESYYSGKNNDFEFLLDKLKSYSIDNNRYLLENYYLMLAYLSEEKNATYKESSVLYNKAIKLAKIKNNKKVVFDAYISLSNLSNFYSKYPNTIKYLNLAESNKTDMADSIYLKMSKQNFFYYMKMYKESIDLSLKILKELDNSTEKDITNVYKYDYEISTYSSLALNYTKLKDYNNAIKYAKISIEKSKRNHSSFDEVYSLSMLSYAYVSNNELKNTKKILNIIKSKMIGDLIDSIGIQYNYQLVNFFYYKKSNNPVKAHKYIMGLNKYLYKNEKRTLPRILKHISDSYYLKQNFKESLNYKRKEIKYTHNKLKEDNIKLAAFYEKKQESDLLNKSNIKLSKLKNNQNKNIEKIKTKESDIIKNIKINVIFGILSVFFVLLFIKFYMKYNKISNSDYLTTLFNRRYVKKTIKKYKKNNENFSFILFDLDYFKKVNDTYGHDVGDKVIIEISNIMKNETRKEDVLSRIGGEEFLIISKSKDKVSEEIAERLRLSIENHNFSKINSKIKITASFGVAHCKRGNLTLEELYNKSDSNLYSAKNKGRNNVIST
jgi:diguanylate cyclase (GGDEF)-like protein